MHDDYSDKINDSRIPIAKLTPHDKKRTPTEVDATNSISANNSNADCITIDAERQSQFEAATKVFNLLFANISAGHFSYLMTFSNGCPITYPYALAEEHSLIEMAQKAIELSELGNDVWHAVNPVCVEPTGGKRGDESAVSYQTAVVVDIDIYSDAHKSNNLAATFEEAKSFLPFPPSIIINSGYGLHAYYIWKEPFAVTDANREEIKRRNNLLIDVVRQRANGKKIDGVGDLPRILRTPGTKNYKLGKENAPMCHIVEVSDVRFTPKQFDEKLSALYVEKTFEPKATPRHDFNLDDDNPDLTQFRIERMLEHISVVDGEYEKWLSVGMALKNEGFDCNIWEQWSRTQPEYKEGECEFKWQGFNRSGYGIGTLYQYAVEGGYDETETRREFYQLYSNSSAQKNSESEFDKLKAQLRENAKAQVDFEAEKKSALETLDNLETFDSKTVFAPAIVTAGAFAKLFDKQAYSNFKRELRLYGDKHPTEKAAVNDWIAAVTDKAASISSRHENLSARKNEVQAQINALSFVANNDLLRGFSIPLGYSLSTQDGVIKVEGEKIVQICRRPIAITSKNFSIEDKIYKLILAYKNADGEWQTMPPVEAATIFNKSKLVDLANLGFPVTSSNASKMVDYFDAFNAENEKNFPLSYSVSRCGWYHFHGRGYFVDPRLLCVLNVRNKKIRVEVDSQSQFSASLIKCGTLAEWKKAYKLAKKSSVARLVVAASIAPILLKVLGERNFLIYVYAPTRAGKTTALYLGASAVGSEKIIRSFDATKNGLAGAAADVNDYPFLIDEKQVADSKIKEQLDSLVYALANGIGRTKLNKDSTLRKTTDWRTIPIMTGETLLLPDNVTGGANTRLLTIAAPSVILDKQTCKEIRSTIAENFGLAFPKVIEKISSIGFERLRKEYNSIVDFFTEKYPDVLDEYCRYMAVLTLADALLNVVLAADEDFSVLLDDAKVLAKEIFPLLPTNAEISDTLREKEFVIAFITQNQSRFIGGNVPLDRMQAFCGKLDDPKFTYITVAALKKACADEGFDYRKLVSDLVADGFFVPSDTIEKGYKNPRPTVKVWLAKSATNCYRFRKESKNEKPPEPQKTNEPEKPIKKSEPSLTQEQNLQEIIDETFGFNVEQEIKKPANPTLEPPPGEPPD